MCTNTHEPIKDLLIYMYTCIYASLSLALSIFLSLSLYTYIYISSISSLPFFSSHHFRRARARVRARTLGRCHVTSVEVTSISDLNVVSAKWCVDHVGNRVWGRRSLGLPTIPSRVVLSFEKEPRSKRYMNREDASFVFAHDIRLNNVRVCNMSKMGNS